MQAESNPRSSSRWLVGYLVLLAVDATMSGLVLTPLLPEITSLEDIPSQEYSLHGSLWDVALLAIPRIVSALFAISVAYHRLRQPSTCPFDQYHASGERKTSLELEEELLEEPLAPKLRRYTFRLPFACEFFSCCTILVICIKCLARLYVEIGIFGESRPKHPVFWLSLATAAAFVLVEVMYIDAVEKLASALGIQRRALAGESFAPTWIQRVTERLAQPLLSQNDSDGDGPDAEESGICRPPSDGRNVREVLSDGHYSSKWSDLIEICQPDKGLVLLAFVFLVAATIANVYVPKFTGEVLDSLISHIASKNTTGLEEFWFELSENSNKVIEIPGFVRNIELLLLVSVLWGVFGGVRGMIFTIVGARVNVRLRVKLLDSIMSQDLGFFDEVRTGELSSRLSSDTTFVSNSVSSNLSIFLRATMRAVGVLAFMFMISWQLSILAFVTVPTVSILSKWYGRYIRRLSKLQQKKLAQGNSVSEAAISSMSTVRAFAAEGVELSEFEICMGRYLKLNRLAAVSTFAYETIVGALPEAVKALVLFYGGLLVQSGSMTGGQLVSFILYLSALSQAFNNLGGVYANLVKGVGAADKVFELMNRTPNVTTPSFFDQDRFDAAVADNKKLYAEGATKNIKQRVAGMYPEHCDGSIVFRSVLFRYPARPQCVVLDNLNITIPAGAVVALVGSSGSGKSSIVKLIHRLYEPSSGEVWIGGYDTKQLSLDFLSRTVSIVPQEPTLFARSVKRNIMYGLEGTSSEPSQEEIEHAARLANAASFIEALPNGYDTQVGDRGTPSLSASAIRSFCLLSNGPPDPVIP